MRLISISFSLLLFLAPLYSQSLRILGKVIDSGNNEVLPYSSLMIIGHTIGTSSDINGNFELSIGDSLKNDSVIISYVGYAPTILKLSDIKSGGLIKLKPQIITINEIVVRPSGKIIKPQIKNQFKLSSCVIRYSPLNTNTNLWIPFRPKEPTIEAMFFPYKAEYGDTRRVKEVWLKVSNYKTPPTYFNLHIFNVSNSQMPDDDLLRESVIVKVTEKEQLIKVNLEKYDLAIPKSGLFVGFELLIIDENKSVIPDGKGASYTMYSPYLNYIPLKELQHFWLYSKGEWIKSFQTTPSHTNKKELLYYKPAISLVLWN
jgi:hypothetical protein